MTYPTRRILQLWRRNQGFIRHNQLHLVGDIEVRRHHHLVTVAVERGVELRIAVVRRIKHHVEDHEARSCSEKPVEEEGIDFARPRVGAGRHQLECTIVGQLFRGKRRELERALVDSEEDKVVQRRRLAALALQEIFEALLARPDGGEKRHIWREMQKQNKPRPEKADSGDDEQPIPGEPVHAAILGKLPFFSQFQIRA